MIYSPVYLIVLLVNLEGVANDRKTLQAGLLWNCVEVCNNFLTLCGCCTVRDILATLRSALFDCAGCVVSWMQKHETNMNKHHERARIPIVGNTCGITAIKACENHPARLCLLSEIAGCLSQSIFVDGPNCSGYLSAWWRITLSMPPASFWTNTKVTHAAKKRKKFRSKGKVQSKYSVISSQAKATLDALQYIAMLIFWFQKKDTGKMGRCLQASLKPLTDPTYPHLGQSWQSPYAKSRLQRCLQRFDLWRREHPPKDSWNLQQGQMDLAGRCHCACHLSGRAHRTCTTSPGMKTVQLVVGNSPPPKFNMNPNQLYTVVKSSALGLHFISFHDKFIGFIKLIIGFRWCRWDFVTTSSHFSET